jgi:hypothetical protein
MLVMVAPSLPAAVVRLPWCLYHPVDVTLTFIVDASHWPVPRPDLCQDPSLRLCVCAQATAASPVNADRVVRSLAVGKGAGASFDPGTQVLDAARDAARVRQEAAEKAWRDKVKHIQTSWKEGGTDAPLDTSVILEEGESLVDGVRVPKNLDGVAAVAFIVTQKQGTTATSLSFFCFIVPPPPRHFVT